MKRANTNNNYFDLIKMFAAFFVIVSHAYPLTLGSGNYDFLYKFTNGQTDFGYLSVCILFIISGYFILKSLNTNDTKSFFIKRIKRIFPPLIIMLFITTFIISPFFYTQSKFYFFNLSPYLYFLKNTFLLTTHTISGVFSNNVYFESINGSLWTLPVEFLLYIFLFIIYKFGILKQKNIKYSIFLLLILTFLQPIFINISPILNTIIPLVLIYFSSSLIYSLNNTKIFNNKLFILLFIILIISFIFNCYTFTKILLLPYVVIFIGRLARKNVLKSNIENLSYEIYLYGFFIQQCVVYILGSNNSVFLNIIFSITITISISYVCSKMLNKIKKVWFSYD